MAEQNVFEKAIAEKGDYIKSTVEGIGNLVLAARIIGDVEGLEDVSNVDVYNYAGLDIYLYLKTEAKASKLVHKLAQKLQVKFEKTLDAYSSDSLKARAELPDGTIITIKGYVPATCTIVEEEVEIPEDQRPTTKKVRRVVCSDEEVKESQEVPF